MPSTYTPIGSTTLGSAQSSVTFSSLGTYTDIIMIYSTTATTSVGNYLRFNSDSGTNYSRLDLYGNGSAVGSNKSTNATGIYGPFSMSTVQTVNTIHIMNGSNTTTFKPVVGRAGASDNSTLQFCGTWRSTSAITSISIHCDGANFLSGSVFTIYGIKAA